MARREPCLVEAAPLARLLDRFITDWSRERPSGAEHYSSGGGRERQLHLSALDYLEEKSTISKSSIQSIRRAAKPGQSRRRIPLSTADRLVTAIGHHGALVDGTLTVSARSARHAATCCDGSLTGVVQPR